MKKQKLTQTEQQDLQSQRGLRLTTEVFICTVSTLCRDLLFLLLLWKNQGRWRCSSISELLLGANIGEVLFDYCVTLTCGASHHSTVYDLWCLNPPDGGRGILPHRPRLLQCLCHVCGHTLPLLLWVPLDLRCTLSSLLLKFFFCL